MLLTEKFQCFVYLSERNLKIAQVALTWLESVSIDPKTTS